MRQDGDALGGRAIAPAPRYVAGVVYDGIDHAAARRAHARALMTARQAAERGHGGPAGPGADRVAACRAEMARIDAAQRAWLLEQGEEVFPLPPRGRSGTSSPRADPDPSTTTSRTTDEPGAGGRPLGGRGQGGLEHRGVVVRGRGHPCSGGPGGAAGW